MVKIEKLELHYTETEMIDFLKKIGYMIETVKTYRRENVYHNNVEYHDTEIVIAFHEDRAPTEAQRRWEIRDIQSEFGIKSIFYREFKTRVLRTLLSVPGYTQNWDGTQKEKSSL